MSPCDRQYVYMCGKTNLHSPPPPTISAELLVSRQCKAGCFQHLSKLIHFLFEIRYTFEIVASGCKSSTADVSVPL